MKNIKTIGKTVLSLICAVFITAESTSFCNTAKAVTVNGVELESEWTTMSIGGGGFVTGIIAGQNTIYARTDVGGAYRWDNGEWIQLMNFISPDDNGLLSVDGLAIDPNDDNTIYMVCGCNYFSNAKTVIFRSTDGGNTFTQSDVSDLIRVHGNGDGRQNGERIAVDPNSPNIIYCGGRTGGLIRSIDYGKTWEMVTDLGVMNTSVKWPSWTNNMEQTTPNTCGIVSVVFDGNSTENGNATSRIFVAASITGQTNIFVSEDAGKTFKELSAQLPTDFYPQRMKLDSNGNLLITYADSAGGNTSKGTICRYHIASGQVDNIGLPDNNPAGDVVCDPNNADKLFASTRGLWWGQKWSTGNTVYGDVFYNSVDGGKTWNFAGAGDENPITNNGCSWIYDKAIHWAGSLAIDPENSDKVFVISGNGIFTSDNMWNDNPDFYFNAFGLEETVPLDMISIPDDPNVYSVIGDYDGFIHESPEANAQQYTPTMGTTVDISYDPKNPNVMVRLGDWEAGYYSLDSAKTWTALGNPQNFKGGSSAITTLDSNQERILRSPDEDNNTYYSDDFGATWTKCDGIGGGVSLVVDSEAPNCVYAANGGSFYYSTDYGNSFNKTNLDNNTGKIIHAYGTQGKVFVPANDGLLVTTDGGKNFTKINTVQYAGAVGVGKAKDDNSPLTIFIYGKVDGTTGIFLSTDDGASWERINDDTHQFGGMGNGNFITGDMNTFGTVYFPTVGLGIQCHRFLNVGDVGSEEENFIMGDVNADGTFNVADVIALQKWLLAVPNTNLENWKAGDFNDDKKLNVFDFCMMKNALINEV